MKTDGMLSQIRDAIDLRLARQDTVTVAIDGSCAAGKTTLAALLAQHYDCNVFHMDDFFLQPGQRTPERYAEAGGNVDYERFYEAVLLPLASGKPFAYRPFDCRTMSLADPVAVTPKRLTIVEGSYCLHPHFGEVYDLKILLTVSPELQRQRILMRPQHLHQRFFTQWIPMEQRYLTELAIPSRCDLIF